MRINAAPQRPATPEPSAGLACTRCQAPQASRGDLALHLTREHQVDPMVAAAEARGWEKEQSMTTPATGSQVVNWVCTVCRERGHTARSCPKRTPESPVECGYCHRAKTDHAPSCKRKGAQAGHKKRKPITRNDPPVKRAKPAQDGADPIATIRAALDQLETELAAARQIRTAMDAAIKALGSR